MPVPFVAMHIDLLERAARLGRPTPSPAAMGLLAALKALSWRSGGLWRPGVRALAEALRERFGPAWGMKRDTLAARLAELERCGYVVSELRDLRGGARRRVYQVLLAPGASFADRDPSSGAKRELEGELEMARARSIALDCQAKDEETFERLARPHREKGLDWPAVVLAVGRELLGA